MKSMTRFVAYSLSAVIALTTSTSGCGSNKPDTQDIKGSQKASATMKSESKDTEVRACIGKPLSPKEAQTAAQSDKFNVTSLLKKNGNAISSRTKVPLLLPESLTI